MEMRQLRQSVRGKPSEIPPEWLPDGWTVEVRNTRHGKYRYYRSPVSGCTFQSKEEVLHHLSVVKHGGGKSGRASCFNESKKQLSEEMKQPLEWLPSGWILEIKSRRSGKRSGKTYKIYIDPLSGGKFYSKGEVLSLLSSRKVREWTSKKKKSLNRNSTDNVIAHIEFSPDGLPHGWIKETKFKEGNGGLNKNHYYTDPVNGYVFNCLKDAIHYVETGYVSKHAYKPKRSVKEVYSLNDDSPSPDSAKKRKSQPARNKHHFTEEILDSNGELSENARVPDGLLQPPSSQENVEVKPEEENPAESVTLSSPCPLNPRQRTPNSGRIRTEKCTRKSHTSFEKANMESEENIKQEKVTEKPSDLSEQTVMIIQSNSKESSKQEDKVTPKVADSTGKLPLVSNEAPKFLPGDELKHIMANQKALAETENLLDPQNKELPVVVGNPSTPDLVKPKHGSRKNKPMNSISKPQRLPRRLAYVEADSMIDVDMGGELPREIKPKNITINLLKEPLQTQNSEAAKTSESFKRQKTIEDGAAAATTNRATMEWPDFASTSPFGDSWLDPCLEFAFKTLTGDIPVFDDAITVQEYFQQQMLSVVGSRCPDVLAPGSNNKTEADPAANEVEMEKK